MTDGDQGAMLGDCRRPGPSTAAPITWRTCMMRARMLLGGLAAMALAAGAGAASASEGGTP
jgi:hypothetical protein